MKANLTRVRTLGPAHPDTIRSLCDLGDLYATQGQRESAETLYRQALTNGELALSPQHPLIAIIFSRLIALYTDWLNTIDVATSLHVPAVLQ
ncbi:MAG: tetratricopeptide repeat protein, partial [Ktedonobacteraceae bacterium]|nr:tetratricopeptide repeat protein [Ktedonobacteraceae bacterium]